MIKKLGITKAIESMKETIDISYIVVSDTNDKVVFHSLDHNEAKREANRIRKCGGQCTVFKSTKL